MQATGKPNTSRGVPPERLYCSGWVTLTCGNPSGEREGYAYVTKSKNPTYWVENAIFERNLVKQQKVKGLVKT